MTSVFGLNNMVTNVNEERIIIHCDMDAFFAAVETLHHDLDPEVPLILGSDPQGGRGRGASHSTSTT